MTHSLGRIITRTAGIVTVTLTQPRFDQPDRRRYPARKGFRDRSAPRIAASASRRPQGVRAVPVS